MTTCRRSGTKGHMKTTVHFSIIRRVRFSRVASLAAALALTASIGFSKEPAWTWAHHLTEDRKVADGWSSLSDKFNVVKKENDSSLQIIDKANGKQVVQTITPKHNDRRTWTVECWAFSPDDKLLVTGSGYVNDKLPENLGWIDVWDITTGKHVEGINASFGRIRIVEFSKDGHSIYYAADRRRIDGR